MPPHYGKYVRQLPNVPLANNLIDIGHTLLLGFPIHLISIH